MISYIINTAITPVEIDSAVAVQTTPDGGRVLVLSAQGVEFFDGGTLERLALPPLAAPDGTGVDAFTLSPDGATVYLVSFGGRVYGFDARTLDPLPYSGKEVVGDSEPPYQIAASADNRTLAIATNAVEIGGRPVGRNQFVTLDTRTFEPIGAPVATGHMLTLHAGRRTARWYLGTPEGVRALDGATLREMWSAPLVLPGMLALAPEEQHLYAVWFDTATRGFVLGRLRDDGRVEREVPVEVGFNPLFMATLGVPFAALAPSVDGTTLWVLGAEPAALRRNQVRSTLLAFDAEELTPYPWSPLPLPGALMPIAIAPAPDANRIFIVAGERIGARDSTSALLVADAFSG
jgi:hypothetical protein